jgi:hypothetical protein
MVKREASTGSIRNNRDGKGRYDLLPPRGLREVAIHFAEGGKAHGDRNWELGQPLSWFVDSGLRHGFDVLSGATDEDHARAWAWNALAFLETRARIKAGLLPAELDDLPKSVK